MRYPYDRNVVQQLVQSEFGRTIFTNGDPKDPRCQQEICWPREQL